jgi:hypothetical protein
MAIKDIFTRQTIIPTDKTRGTQGPSRDTSGVQQIQQQRYQKEQLQHYTRQAEPIKNTVKTNIQNQINQKEEFIRKEKENIEKYKKIKREESDKYWRRDYDKRIDEARDDIRAYEKALGVLKSELDKYDKITDPLEIVGSGTAYGNAVVKYARDVENNQMREDRNRRERAEQLRKFKETEEFKQLQKEYKLSPNISSYELNKVINQANTKGQYDIKTGKFYPTTNTSWIPPGSNASDVIYVTQRMTNWNQVEKKLNDGSILIQLQNPVNKEELVNIGTKYPQQNQVVASSQVPSKTFKASYGFTPIPLKDQLANAPTLGKKAEVLYGYADEKARGFLPGGKTPEQVKGTRGGYQAGAEEYSELKDKGFYEVMGMGQFDLKEFTTWDGKSYNTETAVKALAEITRRDLERNYEDNVLSRAKELTNQYNNQVNQIFNTSSGDANIDKKINAAYDDYEKQVKQLDENWQKGEGKELLDERTKRIEDFKNASAWKSLSLPKIGTAVASGAIIGIVAAPAAAGAFGSTGVAVTTGIQTLGTGALALGVGATAIRLMDEYESGTLNKDRLMSIVGPQIVLIGATAIGGAVGGSIGIAKFKKAQTEFMLNINKQIVGNEALQKQLFTPANLKRGYAEMNYGGYKMRFNVNEKLLAKLQLQNLVIKEGGVLKNTEFINLGRTERIKVIDKFKNEVQLNPDRVIIQEDSLGKIKASAVTKITGQKISGKDWYSLRTMIDNKQADFIFTLSNRGKIMNPYVVVSTKVDSVNGWLVNVGKVIMSTKKVIPVSGQPPILMNQINSIKPVQNFIVLNKYSDSSSILTKGGIKIDVTKNQALVKQILGAKVVKDDKSLFSFLTDKNILKADMSRVRTGSITDVRSVRVATPTGDKTSIFFDVGRGKEIPKITVTDKSKDMFGFSGFENKLSGTSKPVKIPTPSKSTTEFNTDYLLGTKTAKVFKTIDMPKDTIFNTDYLLGVVQTPKTPTVKITAKTSPETGWQFPSLVGAAATIKKEDSVFGQDYTQIGGFNFVSDSKSVKLTKQEEKQAQQDTFGFMSISDNLSLVGQGFALDKKTAQTQATLQATKQKVALKQTQQDLKLQQDIFGLGSIGTTTKVPIPKLTPTKPKPFNWGFPSGSTQPKVAAPKQKDSFWEWGFVAKVRRKGEFKPVSKVVSEKEAFLIGSDIVKNTLGATFKVEKAPKKIKVKKKDSDWEWIDEDFYTKEEKGRTLFIEKRERRLGTKGERKEIQRAKKTKSKTKSFLDWW